METGFKLKVIVRKMGAQIRNKRRLDIMERRMETTMQCRIEVARMLRSEKEELLHLETTRLGIEHQLLERKGAELL